MSNKKVKNGQNVSVHYVGTFDDGTEFDNSRNRGEALTFKVGSGQMITGFDTAVVGMKVGQIKKIEIGPDEGYGNRNEELLRDIPNNVFPEDLELKVDGVVQGTDPGGNPFVARVESINENNVTLDFNHPMAGKRLNFEIELLEMKDG